MLKASMTLAIAMLLIGVSAKTQGTWTLTALPAAQAHVLNWGHKHQCTPSPCPRLKDRHKMGTGSVTE